MVDLQASPKRWEESLEGIVHYLSCPLWSDAPRPMSQKNRPIVVGRSAADVKKEEPTGGAFGHTSYVTASPSLHPRFTSQILRRLRLKPRGFAV
jgi:hypothetical protein